MVQTQQHIIIVGNGIAGVTAARFIRKQSEHKITIISAETEHFFSRTALMYIYMGAMRYEDTKPYSDDFWAKNKIELLLAKVAQVIDTENTIVLQDGKKMAYDTLILACGSKPNSLQNVAGQDLEGVQGLYSFQDLQRLEQYTPKIKKAVIAGGGLIGIELAEMLHSRHIDVTFLVRESAYWANVLPKEEAEMINVHILAQGINLQLNSEIVEILPHAQQPNQVGAVRTKSGQQIDCQFAGLTAGVSPNIAWLQAGAPNLATQRGILVDKYLRSNIPNIYAIGDCAELQTPNADRRSIEAIWYTARMMGETVAHNICQPSLAIAYQPQLWFNSAKFFDIEYQVYGRVPSATQPDTQIDSLFWCDQKAEKSIRIVYQKNTEIVVGFNLLGIRYRHEVCEKWILTQKTLSEVLPQLSLANFDPEFSLQHEKMLCLAYQEKTGKPIALTQKRGLSAVWHFLTGK